MQTANRTSRTSKPMKTFIVHVQNRPHNPILVPAHNEAEALWCVHEQGLSVLSLHEQKGPSLRSFVSFFPQRSFPTLLFCQELCSLMEAGLTPSEAIGTLAQKESTAVYTKVVTALYQHLLEGQRLSDVLASQSLPMLLVANIRAAEQTGAICDALTRYLNYRQEIEAFTNKLTAALVYPCTVLVIGLGVVSFLVGYVLPRFANILTETGHTLPYLSQKLFALGQWIGQHPALITAILATVIGTIGMLWSREEWRRTCLAYLASRGPWSVQLTRYKIARLLHSVSMLLDAGIPLPKALQLTRDMLVGPQRAHITHCIRHIQEGQTLSYALRREQLSDSITDSLVRVGEKTGALGPLLLRAARFHEQNFSRWIDQLMRIAEPLIMTALGLLVGGIVILMYMPIFNLASDIL